MAEINSLGLYFVLTCVMAFASHKINYNRYGVKTANVQNIHLTGRSLMEISDTKTVNSVTLQERSSGNGESINEILKTTVDNDDIRIQNVAALPNTNEAGVPEDGQQLLRRIISSLITTPPSSLASTNNRNSPSSVDGPVSPLSRVGQVSPLSSDGRVSPSSRKRQVSPSFGGIHSNTPSFWYAEDAGVCPDEDEPDFRYTDGRKPNGRRVKLEVKSDFKECQQLQPMNEKRLVFKRPEYVWGNGFNNTNTKSLCGTCIDTRGDTVQRIRYTKRGMDLCSKACIRQERLMLRVAPTKVLLMDDYCTKQNLLPATCVCVFKISSQEYRHCAFTHFIVNRVGNVAMLYFEAGHPITKDLDRL